MMKMTNWVTLLKHYLVEMDVVDHWLLSILSRVIQVGRPELEPLHLLITGTQKGYLEEDRFKLLKCQAHADGDFIRKENLEEFTQPFPLASVLMYRLCLSQLRRYKKICN